MIKDKLREEFEAAYVEDMVRIIGEGIRTRAVENTQFLMQNGEFQDPALRLALWAWKASRETLVIELPKAWQTNVGAMLTPNGVRFAIKAAGLKVAP
jgi:hypothetical protein